MDNNPVDSAPSVETVPSVGTQYNPSDGTYGSTYMEKARGRILFAISEMNTTRKGLNALTNMFSSNESTGAAAKGLRGAAYKEALRQISSMPAEELGNYSTVSNAFGFSSRGSTLSGGKRGKKSNRKTNKRGKKH